MELHLPVIHQQSRHHNLLLCQSFFKRNFILLIIFWPGFSGCWKFCNNCTEWVSDASAMKSTWRWETKTNWLRHKDKLYLNTKMDTCGAKKSANSTWRWNTEAQCMNVQVKNQSGTLGYHAFLEVVFMKDSVWSFLDQALVDQWKLISSSCDITCSSGKMF